MFCADYCAAFFVHAIFLSGTSQAAAALPASLVAGDWSRDAIRQTLGLDRGSSLAIAAPAAAGALSGLVGTCAVSPLDFVRRSLLPGFSALALLRAGLLSTIPYTTTLFGVYFSQRDARAGPRSQFPWALAAAALAAGVEAPLGRAKAAMFLGRRSTLVGASLLYAPFAAGMLVMCDTAALRTLAKYEPGMLESA